MVNFIILYACAQRWVATSYIYFLHVGVGQYEHFQQVKPLQLTLVNVWLNSSSENLQLAKWALIFTYLTQNANYIYK